MTSSRHALTEGQPCWAELVANDAAGARDFYDRLFGWDFVPSVRADLGHSFATLNGVPVAGIGPAVAEIPDFRGWMIYLQTPDIVAALLRAQAGDAEVAVTPISLGEGRFAFGTDPGGVTFGLFEDDSSFDRPAPETEPGSVIWHELMTRDYEGSQEFYRSLVGYRFEELAGDGEPAFSAITTRSGRTIGGLGSIGPEFDASVPPHWMPYFRVDNVTTTCNRALYLGGEVRTGPLSSPEGPFAVLADPQGAAFAVIAPVDLPD
ncbi:VOC family protein [Arsenicicoccus piscis]|uniref:Glyoxalase n=1 Tax=Arsenicicoccus piscis TaxID=673954 RepID=A0ABQ6HUG4_9MICO|nr:VOC family protein [Arsenicicoccus piscis]MCH8626563.1 VOC family protein [Arsenicicoccus piscis]GMA21210.1 glyoxalase [Arsenicicoccus piscis]